MRKWFLLCPDPNFPIYDEACVDIQLWIVWIVSVSDLSGDRLVPCALVFLLEGGIGEHGGEDGEGQECV